ncbi:MAG: hypothetical protein BGN87_06375 [Rhizobiales bacterium 65-79]|jgi:hypothetical protein|nr:hypothetical protein [Hyphomicrobiales bacterium]OJU02815.1 MAG: hypothetical protein BGN87_06375 [Rhizobiales bacterium 65-79]
MSTRRGLSPTPSSSTIFSASRCRSGTGSPRAASCSRPPFREGGRTFAGNIVAPGWAEAEKIAFGRGLGEQVIGQLVETGAGGLPDWTGRE